MQEVSTASDEQSRGILQIEQAVTEMDGVTQQNAALVQESASAASSLEEQVNYLKTPYRHSSCRFTQHRLTKRLCSFRRS